MPESDKQDLLPPIEELTTDQANRLICADYLRTLATMIERGALQAFDLSWAARVAAKPIGKLVMDAGFLMCDAEKEFEQKIEEYKAKQAAKIQVEDCVQELKNTDPN